MAKVTIPAEPRPNTTIYSQFRGVHLTDPYLCDISHSPYALNLISNNEGLPEIRPGWRALHTLPGVVNCLAHGIVNGVELFFAHVGTKLYTWTNSIQTEIYNGLSDAKSKIFFATHNNMTKAFIMTGAEYMVYDGTTVQSVEAMATVPVILIAKTPTGGGTPLYPVNMLQAKRTEKFQGNGTAKDYQLSANNLDHTTIVVKEVTASGEVTRTDATVNAATGKVTFTTAPPAPSVTGTDNIFITYSKTVSGYADRVKKCRIHDEYGETGNGRIFISGNPDYRNYDWWSELSDPTYFPDLNYGIVGNANTAIMGYAKIGRYQMVVKEDNQQDATIFLRYPAQTAGGAYYFKLETGIAGTGAIARGSFVNLVDEPLFLARTGLYAIVSNNITAERTLQNRSYFVDEHLTHEENMQNAVATEWNGYCLIALNEKIYAFNSRSKEAHGIGFVYNCFLWNNIAATCFLVIDGELYFGDSQGRICKMNTDLAEANQYNDNGAAINVIWSTKLDNDGLPHMVKTLSKKGTGITVKPFTRSTYDVYLLTERTGAETLIMRFYRDIFDLNDFNLDRLSLESSPSAKFTPFKKKVKKYESMQILVKASALDEGFGIYNIVKQWLPVNYVRR